MYAAQLVMTTYFTDIIFATKYGILYLSHYKFKPQKLIDLNNDIPKLLVCWLFIMSECWQEIVLFMLKIN